MALRALRTGSSRGPLRARRAPLARLTARRPRRIIGSFISPLGNSAQRKGRNAAPSLLPADSLPASPTRKEHSVKNLLVALCVIVAFCGLAFVQAAQKPAPPAQAPDALVGTWELNVAKSTFTLGTQFKASTRTFEAAGEGLKYSGRNVSVDGRTTGAQWTAYYDGKDHPVTGHAFLTTISMTRTDRFTSESRLKGAGKALETNRRVVSPDGKILTVTTEGTDDKGAAYKMVLVFDRK